MSKLIPPRTKTEDEYRATAMLLGMAYGTFSHTFKAYADGHPENAVRMCAETLEPLTFEQWHARYHEAHNESKENGS